MRYAVLPRSMWLLFHRSFREKLVSVLGYGDAEASRIEKRALSKYREVVCGLPEFERGDRFEANILSCAILAAFYLNMEVRPDVGQMSDYYEAAMMCAPMRIFCRMAGKRKFSRKDVADMKATAAMSFADRNPYSWNMEFIPYPDGSGYEARFTSCGICVLMKELGIEEIVGALCHLDYAMSETFGTTEFVRRHTLASGGPYCDCGYKKNVGQKS